MQKIEKDKAFASNFINKFRLFLKINDLTAPELNAALRYIGVNKIPNDGRYYKVSLWGVLNNDFKCEEMKKYIYGMRGQGYIPQNSVPVQGGGKEIVFPEKPYKDKNDETDMEIASKKLLDNDEISYITESVIKQLMDARKDVNRNPSDAQKKAGNYKMGHIRILGFTITIENPKGSYRRGKDRNGKEWKVKMNNDYGYFTLTKGKDGDAIDVFIGPHRNSKKVFAIDQKIGGKFDETKIMLCFNTKEEAKEAYMSNYAKDWKGFWHITGVSVETFKKWLYDGYRQRKPFYQYAEFKGKTINEDKLLSFNGKTEFVNFLKESLSSLRLFRYFRKHGGLQKELGGKRFVYQVDINKIKDDEIITLYPDMTSFLNNKRNLEEIMKERMGNRPSVYPLRLADGSVLAILLTNENMLMKNDSYRYLKRVDETKEKRHR